MLWTSLVRVKPPHLARSDVELRDVMSLKDWVVRREMQIANHPPQISFLRG